MRLVRDIAELQRERPTILTVGSFDGVHRGHQFLIREVVERARHMDFQSLVVTFDPRPTVLLRPGSDQLTGGADKARLIGALGPDVLALMSFTRELSELTADQFLARLLDHVNLAEAWVGADFAFGYKRAGNVDFLIENGQRSGFSVMVVARQALGGEEISSTRARELVRAGDVARATELLGHYPSLSGRVVTGFGQGAGLGFPTANIEPPPEQLLPATGIYAAYLRIGGASRPAAAYVGTRPVFDGHEIVVEAYVLDFDGDLRDQPVGLDFVERIREDRSFPSETALVEQMSHDVARTREILAASHEPGELLLLP